MKWDEKKFVIFLMIKLFLWFVLGLPKLIILIRIYVMIDVGWRTKESYQKYHKLKQPIRI